MGGLARDAERIWPVDELLSVFPDYVLFRKEKERSVDGEAVLPDGDGVVQSHSPGSLCFGLLEGSWGPSRRSRRSLPAPVLVRAPISGAQPASHCLPKASHPGRKHTGEPKEHRQGSRAGRRVKGGLRGAVPTTAPSSSLNDAQLCLSSISPRERGPAWRRERQQHAALPQQHGMGGSQLSPKPPPRKNPNKQLVLPAQQRPQHLLPQSKGLNPDTSFPPLCLQTQTSPF